MSGDYLQAGPTNQSRPALGNYYAEQRNSTNTDWAGVAPENWLAHAAGDIPCNSQNLTLVRDPTSAQHAATKNYVDTIAGVVNAPAWLKGTAATTDATPTSLLSSAYAVPSGSVSRLEAVVTVKKADLSVIATYTFTGTFVNNAGTLKQIGDGTDTGAVTLYHESPPQMLAGTFAGSCAFSMSGTSVQVQGTGVAASSYTWKARLRIDEN